MFAQSLLQLRLADERAEFARVERQHALQASALRRIVP